MSKEPISRESTITNSASQRRYWNNYFTSRKLRMYDLDWGFEWIRPHLEFLKSQNVHRILDLGCGTGSDCLRLSELGYEVVGIDFSPVALKWANKKARIKSGSLTFQECDFSQPLDFPAESFDAVISHLSLHIFSDLITRRVFDQVWTLLKPSGIFLFEVNSVMDMQYRPYRRIKQLEPYYFLEEQGQTMHFFTKDYIKSLLQRWNISILKHIKRTSEKGTKCVWHCLAQNLEGK